MVKNRSIQVRLTRDQYERIKNNCSVKGFTHLSEYLRHVALDQDLLLQCKIYEIHEHLLGPPKTNRKFKQNPAVRS